MSFDMDVTQNSNVLSFLFRLMVDLFFSALSLWALANPSLLYLDLTS